jgi:hypothetical protein
MDFEKHSRLWARMKFSEADTWTNEDIEELFFITNVSIDNALPFVRRLNDNELVYKALDVLREMLDNRFD